jgi:hypothetical protein
VRPEHRQCRPIGSEGHAGRIEEVVYLGTITKSYITLDATTTPLRLIAKTLSGGGASVYRVGDRVAVSWRPQDAWMLPDQDR